MREFKKTEFVIFDVETTGLSPARGDRIIELAGLKIRDLIPVEAFHSLIDPQRDIPLGAFLVHGISSEMLQGAPQAHEILPDFVRFIGDACLVGHNIRFDLGFLCHELSVIENNLKEDLLTFDTLQMARSLLPGLSSYRLASLSYSLGITRIQQHRAMADVEMTHEVFRILLEIADRKDICDMQELTRRYGRNIPKEMLKTARGVSLSSQERVHE